jgi:nicotinamide riboside transporter PnuC
VDLPQHLHLISVLHRLDDASTLFPEVFARRPQLTPYLGYYYLVSLLNWLMPLELANRVFLSAYVAGLPLSLAFLLRSLRRPTWPALLALPFAYGDSFAWGFINYCAALPLAFLTCGFFVRAIEDAPRRRTWALWLAVGLTAVLLFHVQVFAWLAVALPFLLLTTPAPEGRKAWRARVPAVAGLVPGVLLFIVWVALRLGQPQEIAWGQPWKSWGPMLSAQNLAWKSFEQNLGDLVSVPRGADGSWRLTEIHFPLLAGMAPDGADQQAVRLVLLLALAAIALAKVQGRDVQEGPIARWRIVGLAALGFVLFFALPFDIRGYMYYLNTRYMHLAAALLVASVPPLTEVWSRRAVWAGVAAAIVMMLPLYRAFSDFDQESRALTELSALAAPKPRVMGLIFATGSRAVTHPVYLHASAVIARERGGLTNFSFALTPHSPLMYRTAPPPTFASEWRPDQMRWEEHGRFYDHFLLRGVRPEQVFGARLQSELYVAAEAGDWVLVRKR